VISNLLHELINKFIHEFQTSTNFAKLLKFRASSFLLSMGKVYVYKYGHLNKINHKKELFNKIKKKNLYTVFSGL